MGEEGEPCPIIVQPHRKARPCTGDTGGSGAGNSGLPLHVCLLKEQELKAPEGARHTWVEGTRLVGRVRKKAIDPPRLPATPHIECGTVPFQTEPTSSLPPAPPTFPRVAPPLPQALPPTGS